LGEYYDSRKAGKTGVMKIQNKSVLKQQSWVYFCDATTQFESRPPRCRGFSRSHNVRHTQTHTQTR